MIFQLTYTKEALRDLHKLDRATAERILKKLDFWRRQSNPIHFSKPLQGDFKDCYRFRVGDYRIIFRLNEFNKMTILLILRVQHRREIYRV